MGGIRDFQDEMLVIAVLQAADARESGAPARLEAALEALFGTIAFGSPEFAFEWTNYYEGEMGKGILRSFLAFDRLVDPSTFAEVKIATNRLEEDFSREGKRIFNLDPGLLSLGRFMLATTKDRAHRIPLRSGIYAELTLQYEKGEFRAMPWTYPDWRSEKYRRILAELRLGLKTRLKGRQ